MKIGGRLPACKALTLLNLIRLWPEITISRRSILSVRSDIMNNTQSGDGHGGRGLHFFPQGADFSLIFLHGRGCSGEGWSSLIPAVQTHPKLKGKVRILLPTADDIPITRLGGDRMPAWFDSRSRDRDADEDTKGMLSSRARVQQLVDREIKAQIKSDKIVVGGFSQGGAIAYLYALTPDTNIAGAISLSGWCPMRSSLKINENFLRKPGAGIMHCHGTSDDVVPFEYAKKTQQEARRLVEASGGLPSKIMFRTYPGLSHSSCSSEIEDVLDFLCDAFDLNALK